MSESDVLRPKLIPKSPTVEEYVQMLRDSGYPPVLRTGSSVGENKIFSSAQARQLIEEQFLIKGVKIRSMCPNLYASARPLGFHGLKTFGFGATIITFRNCPNNCPLVFWVGDPWHALTPRKTNSDSELETFLEDSE